MSGDSGEIGLQPPVYSQGPSTAVLGYARCLHFFNVRRIWLTLFETVYKLPTKAVSSQSDPTKTTHTMPTKVTSALPPGAFDLVSNGAADERKMPIATIDELIKRRAAELNDSPLIGYPRRGLVDFEEHSARAIDRYADAAVVILQRLGLQAVVCKEDRLITPTPLHR